MNELYRQKQAVAKESILDMILEMTEMNAKVMAEDKHPEARLAAKKLAQLTMDFILLRLYPEKASITVSFTGNLLSEEMAEANVLVNHRMGKELSSQQYHFREIPFLTEEDYKCIEQYMGYPKENNDV